MRDRGLAWRAFKRFRLRAADFVSYSPCQFQQNADSAEQADTPLSWRRTLWCRFYRQKDCVTPITTPNCCYRLVRTSPRPRRQHDNDEPRSLCPCPPQQSACAAIDTQRPTVRRRSSPSRGSSRVISMEATRRPPRPTPHQYRLPSPPRRSLAGSRRRRTLRWQDWRRSVGLASMPTAMGRKSAPKRHTGIEGHEAASHPWRRPPSARR